MTQQMKATQAAAEMRRAKAIEEYSKKLVLASKILDEVAEAVRVKRASVSLPDRAVIVNVNAVTTPEIRRAINALSLVTAGYNPSWSREQRQEWFVKHRQQFDFAGAKSHREVVKTAQALDKEEKKHNSIIANSVFKPVRESGLTMPGETELNSYISERGLKKLRKNTRTGEGRSLYSMGMNALKGWKKLPDLPLVKDGWTTKKFIEKLIATKGEAEVGALLYYLWKRNKTDNPAAIVNYYDSKNPGRMVDRNKWKDLVDASGYGPEYYLAVNTPDGTNANGVD